MRNETRFSRREIDRTHVILTLLAIAGLVLFILACRPSWSPDSRKVLYSVWDGGAKKAAVVLFDRKTRTSRVIFEWTKEDSSDMYLAGAQWTKDGKKAIVTTYAEEGLQVLVFPVDTQKPMQAYTLTKMGNPAMVPYPQVGNQLFVMGEKARGRVDLATGEILRKEAQEDPVGLLYEAGSKIFYLRQVSEKTEETKKETDEKKTHDEARNTLEVGELDQKELNLHSTLRLSEEEFEKKGIGEMTGFADVDPITLKIALTAEPLQGKQPGILVIGKEGLEQVLEVNTREKLSKIGNPQWSRDGKSIYAGALIQDEKTKKAEFGVVEVPVDGKRSRYDPIEEGTTQDLDDDFLNLSQIALSPDGKLIAVTNGHSNDIPPEKKGLFLLDVIRPERPVAFYPAPALPALPKKDKE